MYPQHDIIRAIPSLMDIHIYKNVTLQNTLLTTAYMYTLNRKILHLNYSSPIFTFQYESGILFVQSHAHLSLTFRMAKIL